MERITGPERKVIHYFQSYMMVCNLLCLVSTNLLQKYRLKEPNQNFDYVSLGVQSQGALTLDKLPNHSGVPVSSFVQWECYRHVPHLVVKII